MSDSEQSEYLSDMWRNSLICDVYEPGSTFKLVTLAAALEQGVVAPQVMVDSPARPPTVSPRW